jgi:predicted methyltransferase
MGRAANATLMPIIERAILCRQRPVSRRYSRIGRPRCKVFKVLRPGKVVLIFDHWQPPNETMAKVILAMRRPRRRNFG